MEILIHIAAKGRKTACGLKITSKTNQWGHKLASDGGPITEYRTCVNCVSCSSVVPERVEVMAFGAR
jgi:hypothetical protein